MENSRLNFRAWHREAKGYYYFNIYELRKYSLDEYDDDDIEQCTGLKDKNGKFIYDGDILQNCEQRIIVVFDEQRHCFMFDYQDAHAYKPISCIDVLDSDKFEVIGNIHENGSLLNED